MYICQYMYIFPTAPQNCTRKILEDIQELIAHRNTSPDIYYRNKTLEIPYKGCKCVCVVQCTLLMGETAAAAVEVEVEVSIRWGRRWNNRKVEEATRRQKAEVEDREMPVIVQRAEKNVYVCVQLCQVYAATTKSSLGRIELVLQQGMERQLPKVAKGFVDHTHTSLSQP